MKTTAIKAALLTALGYGLGKVFVIAPLFGLLLPGLISELHANPHRA